jgi:8-oxo-dGTP pyrophosphatase MutT (NUDIX family)
LENFPVEKRAGGIVIVNDDGQILFLLVTSNSNRTKWIIPAGHIEEGERAEETALREVEEEAGVKASIISDLGSFQYNWYRDNKRILIDTHIYLMKFSEIITQNPEGRQVKYFGFKEIMKMNLWEESRTFIEKAYQYIVETKE